MHNKNLSAGKLSLCLQSACANRTVFIAFGAIMIYVLCDSKAEIMYHCVSERSQMMENDDAGSNGKGKMNDGCRSAPYSQKAEFKNKNETTCPI